MAWGWEGFSYGCIVDRSVMEGMPGCQVMSMLLLMSFVLELNGVQFRIGGIDGMGWLAVTAAQPDGRFPGE
jgi:hypothetical protein